MKFSSVAFLALALSAPAFAQSAGDACVDGDPLLCGDSNDLLECDGSVYASVVTCPSDIPGTVCADLPCTGACDGFVACVGDSTGDTCIGVGPLLDSDSNNDSSFMAVPCRTGLACQVQQNGSETCITSPNNITCTSPSDSCAGDKHVICVGDENGELTITSPAVIDCASFGLTCGINENGENSCIEDIDPACGASGAGSCQGTVAVTCSDNQVIDENDCANFGQACVDFGGSFGCVTPDPECGGNGLGQCSGNVASICQNGSFVNETNCADIGRVCGPVNANGQIGCVVPGGEGEGEGEGEPECSRDSDCEDDEECDDGQCRRIRSTRGGSEEPAPESPLAFLGCSQASLVSLPSGVALIGLLAVSLRRRRR